MKNKYNKNKTQIFEQIFSRVVPRFLYDIMQFVSYLVTFYLVLKPEFRNFSSAIFVLALFISSQEVSC